VIKSFRRKGIRDFFETGSLAGIQPKHAKRLAVQLDVLDDAIGAEDMQVPGWKCHALEGKTKGFWAVSVSGNWRLTFCFEDRNAVLVDYQDYH
jgi:proteic killer suppression protein